MNSGEKDARRTTHESTADKWFHRFIWALIAGMGVMMVYLFMSHFLEVVL